MSNNLSCPACGTTTFYQKRTTSLNEYYVVSFSLCGEIEDECFEDQERNGEESGAYYCQSCGWELMDENGAPITDPDEIVAKFEQAAKTPAHIREAFQDFPDGDEDTVDVDDEQRGLPWFVETLNDCTDILPINYCFDLGLPHRSSYGDAVKHLAKEASK
jgi:hypothetical protein